MRRSGTPTVAVPEGGVTILPGTCFAHVAAIGNAPVRAPRPIPKRSRRVSPELQLDDVLPVLGVVSAPTAVLIRPDGYVAGFADGTQAGLPDALGTSFGAPTGA
jgi:hypothetical protein